jgi:ABC-type multidrug transport system fused ATPase/permease subunit
VINAENRYTLIAVSNDPLIMAACDRVILLNNGQISDEGHFDELLKKGTINNYID